MPFRLDRRRGERSNFQRLSPDSFTMTTFDVLSGRLTLDTSPWQNALRQAQPILAQFVANMGRALDTLKLGVSNVATTLVAIRPALAELAAAGAMAGQTIEQSLAKAAPGVQAAAGTLVKLTSAPLHGRHGEAEDDALPAALGRRAGATADLASRASPLAQPAANKGRALEALNAATSNVAKALESVRPALTGLAATVAKATETIAPLPARVAAEKESRIVDRGLRIEDEAEGEIRNPQSGIPATTIAAAGSPVARNTIAGNTIARNPAPQPGPLPQWGAATSSAADNSEPMQTLMAYGEAVLAQFQRNAELLGQDRETSLKNARDVQTAVEGLAATVKLGDNDLEAFGKNAEEAAAKAKELGNDLAALKNVALKNIAALDAAQKKNAFQAEGMPAPQEHAMGQTLNQFVQMAQGAAMKIAMGPSELNDLIAQAQAKGDPLAALDLIIQNVQMKVGQSNFNLHQLASTAGSLGSTGDAFPGVDNSAYLKSINDPAAVAAQQFTDLLARLQQQRAALVKQLAQGKPRVPGVGPLPRMATGGITVGPMTALIGEDGPEAVIPLTSLWNQLQQTLRQNLGGTLASFTSNFSKWSQTINQQMNAGNFANSGFLQNMASQNMAMVQSLHQYQEHSQIDLQPVRGRHVMGGTKGMGSPRRGMGGVYTGDTADQYAGPATNIIVNVQGADLTTPAGARQVANLLVPHIDAVAKRMGTDMTGQSALRSMQPPFNAAPTAYAR
jgi:hypothetical protein